MPPFRPQPHVPVAGSVRAHDLHRLQKLRRRLAHRWQRRRGRLPWLFALALTALAAAVLLAVRLGAAALRALPRDPAEEAGVLLLFLVAFAVGVHLLLRFDRTRRRARAARIRLHHVERRLSSLASPDADGDDGGRRVG